MKSADKKLSELLSDKGVIGFSPSADAINNPTDDGLIIYYVESGNLYRVERSRVGKDIWKRPKDISPPTAISELQGDFSLRSKQPFDELWTVLKGVDGVHTGVVWGIVTLYGNDIIDGRAPHPRQLEQVPGIGDTIASRITSKFNNSDKINYGV